MHYKCNALCLTLVVCQGIPVPQNQLAKPATKLYLVSPDHKAVQLTVAASGIVLSQLYHQTNTQPIFPAARCCSVKQFISLQHCDTSIPEHRWLFTHFALYLRMYVTIV